MVKPRTNPLVERDVPLGNLLGAAAQRLSTELTIALHAAGFSDLRAAHAPIFQAIDGAGTRASVLAERTRLSKQAMGEQLQYLTTRGYLSSTTDPADGRARIVELTEQGWAAIDAAQNVIDRFDAWLAHTLGQATVAHLRGTLELIITAERAGWQTSAGLPAMPPPSSSAVHPKPRR